MKTILLSFLLSLNCFAGFVAGSKINLCNRTDYSSPSICQELEGEICYQVPNDSGECGIYKLQDLYGNVKFDQESCEGQPACQALLESKVCGAEKHGLIDQAYTEVYCVEVIGKELVIDQVVKAQKDAERLAKFNQDAALAAAKKLRECGSGVLDVVLVRNGQKVLTTTQVKLMVQIYAPIKGLLETGSLNSAKEEVQAIDPDGTLVTAGDKTAVIAAIDSCLGGN